MGAERLAWPSLPAELHAEWVISLGPGLMTAMYHTAWRMEFYSGHGRVGKDTAVVGKLVDHMVSLLRADANPAKWGGPVAVLDSIVPQRSAGVICFTCTKAAVEKSLSNRLRANPWYGGMTWVGDAHGSWYLDPELPATSVAALPAQEPGPWETVCVGAASGAVSSQQLLALLEEHGCCVLRGYVPGYVTQPLRDWVYEWTKSKLKLFHRPVIIHGEDFAPMLDIPSPDWEHRADRPAPIKWANHRWGVVKQRGYISELGGGKLYQHPDFLSHPAIDAAQEHMRHCLAALHSCPVTQLQREREGCSLKPLGAPEGGAHIDPGDDGRFQVVLAATAGHFLVWPGTHKIKPSAMKHRELRPFYLDDKYMAQLQAQGYSRWQIPCNPGDVLLFQGGRLIHGSPGVPATPGNSTRVMTYCKFWPPTSETGQRLARKRAREQ